jgi:ribosomal protein S27AE
MSKRWLVATKLYGVKSPKRVTLNLQDCLQCSRTAIAVQHRTQPVSVLLCLHVQLVSTAVASHVT